MEPTGMGERWEELDVVRLTVDLPEAGLRRGDVGTILDVYGAPELAYEVEFADEEGRTRALPALRPEQLERVRVSRSRPKHER